MLRRLPVRVDELVDAFDEPVGGTNRWFLDLQTGALEIVPRETAETEGMVDLAAFEDVVRHPERWREVPPLPGRVRADLRERFADGVSDPQHRRLLLDAMAERGSFAAFARVLRQHEPLRDEWFRFRETALRDAAIEWLELQGIAPAEVARA
jgi:hypothetical protein